MPTSEGYKTNRLTAVANGPRVDQAVTCPQRWVRVTFAGSGDFTLTDTAMLDLIRSIVENRNTIIRGIRAIRGPKFPPMPIRVPWSSIS